MLVGFLWFVIRFSFIEYSLLDIQFPEGCILYPDLSTAYSPLPTAYPATWKKTRLTPARRMASRAFTVWAW